MAADYYSLAEVAEKLGKTEDQIKSLILEGKLREFRDGADILFNAQEVDSLAAGHEVDLAPGAEDLPELSKDDVELLPDDAGEIDIDDISADEATASFAGSLGISSDDEDSISIEDSVMIPESPASKPDESIGVADISDESIGVSDATTTPDAVAGSSSADDSLNFSDSLKGEENEDDSFGDLDLASLSGSDLSLGDLSALSGGDIDLSELSGADTNIDPSGVKVLNKNDKDFKISDDSTSDTNFSDGTGGMMDSLGDLDADINLDSVGSGSGLLDLSLQADDTSLGAVLDDILPPAGEGGDISDIGEDEPLAEAANAPIFSQGQSSVGAMEPMMARQAVAIPPDAFSKACGIELFLPLIAVIYGVILVFAAQSGIKPSILTAVENYIWYIAGGLAFVAVMIVTIAALMGSKGSKKKKDDVYHNPE
jgi:hypothetical protein